MGIDAETKHRLNEVILGFSIAQSKVNISKEEHEKIRQLEAKIKIEVHLTENIKALQFWELVEESLFAIKKQLFREEHKNRVLLDENIKTKIQNQKILDLYGELANHAHLQSTKANQLRRKNRILTKRNNRLSYDSQTKKRIVRTKIRRRTILPPNSN
jgi:hypothetical protein